MRRGLVHALAWSLATGASVTLSWWGVHTVLAGTVYDPPRALPIPSGTSEIGEAAGSGAADAADGSADDPLSSPSGTPATPSGSASPARGGTGRPSAPATPPRSPAPPTGTPAPPTPAKGTDPGPGAGSGGTDSGTGSVKSYGTDGGRVVFDLGETSAELVSARPESGWQMQVWKQPTWIRVTFTQGSREISVFCVWHDTAPRVEIEER
ncbi:hypothetical protein [Streptomyces sp. NPDC090025]|uniref:hypothetical protein n=1 Tax=Streptomyces sp. NPDC090025 TaxID=3365922 RepID=UPI0038392D65